MPRFALNRYRTLSFVTFVLIAPLVYWFTLGPRVITFHSSFDLTTPPPYEDSSSSCASTRILLVSALFPLAKSKHTDDDYAQWLKLFLGRITTDIYFYTPPAFEAVVRKARGNLPITINTTYTSPFDVPPLVGLEAQYAAMHTIDREKDIHSPELYAVWSAKAFLLDEATRISSPQYDLAFWLDAGSFRQQHSYRNWPDCRRTKEVWEKAARLTAQSEEDLFFIPIEHAPPRHVRSWHEALGPIDESISEGSFFGGSPKAVAWWRETYYKYHDHYLSQGLFVGKDQTVFNSILVLFPSRIFTVYYNDEEAPERVGFPSFSSQYNLGRCGSYWYYFEFWLADPATQDQMRAIWDSSAHWWAPRVACRVAQTLALRDVFQRQFGKDWTTPQAMFLS